MGVIRLYLDEDVSPLLAVVLRDRGFDAVSAHELGRTSLPDSNHLNYATREGRVLLTFNVKHFVLLATERWNVGDPFPGVIVSTQLPFKDMLRRVLRLLNGRTEESIRDSVVWLNEYP